MVSGRDAPLCYPGFSVRDSAEGHRPGRNHGKDLRSLHAGPRKRCPADGYTVAVHMQPYRGLSTEWYPILGLLDTACREIMTRRSVVSARPVLPRANGKIQRQDWEPSAPR